MAAAIKNAKQAWQTVKDISEPSIDEKTKGEKAYAVATFIKEKSFRTVVDKQSQATVREYWAGLFNPGAGDIVSFQATEPYSDPKAPIKVWYVPLVSVDDIINRRDHKIPVESLAVVNLADYSHQPPFICTMKLTGCCFVFGWDEKKGCLYLAHIEPTQVHDRSFIAKYVRENEVLPIPKSQLAKYVCFGGDDQELPSGYNKYTVNIVGFILSTRIYMVFRFEYQKENGSMVWDLQKS
ncbi:hypothetical protein L7F22_042714 [Adiantum nelumboides]|nr:hypothetical protein [Adiantum nelumboides]